MLVLIYFLVTIPFQISGWEIFLGTKFKWEYIEEKDMQAEIPIFDNEIKALEGEEITLTGYYLPIDISGERIILSRMPYASCFFCGGGVGLESVAEIQFETKPRDFMMDEIITVTGRLKLNERDYGHLVFILTDASVSTP